MKPFYGNPRLHKIIADPAYVFDPHDPRLGPIPLMRQQQSSLYSYARRGLEQVKDGDDLFEHQRDCSEVRAFLGPWLGSGATAV